MLIKKNFKAKNVKKTNNNNNLLPDILGEKSRVWFDILYNNKR